MPTLTAGGSGHVGPVRLNTPRSGALAIDSTKLDAPTQAYDADAGWIEYKPGEVSLFFAKEDRDRSDTLFSRLQVRYPPEDFVHVFWGTAIEFFEKLKLYVSAWPADARDGGKASARLAKLPTSRAHSEWASFTSTSHSGSEASLDFYHLAPQSILKFIQTKNLEGVKPRPVVRVQMTTFQLFELMDAARALVPKIIEDLPPAHRSPESTAEPEE